MDIFAIQTLDLTNLIQSRFSSLRPAYRTFNASLLNASLPSVEEYINGQINNDSERSGRKGRKRSGVGDGYMFATLLAGNATVFPNTTGGLTGGQNNGSGMGGGHNPPPKKGNQLAMLVFPLSLFRFPSQIDEGMTLIRRFDRIILYTITGCVSALFCIVILSG